MEDITKAIMNPSAIPFHEFINGWESPSMVVIFKPEFSTFLFVCGLFFYLLQRNYLSPLLILLYYLLQSFYAHCEFAIF